LAVLAALWGGAIAAAPAADFSPYVDESFPRNLYWGDTHLHSSLSTDAFGFGVRLGPEQAYRFASGEQVTTSHGLQARLGRPLDFVVLADHAESFGIMERVWAGDPRLLADPEVAEWHRLLHGTAQELAEFGRKFLTQEVRKQVITKMGQLATPELSLAIWRENLAIAERFNRPGVFTTLLGYEWTSAPDGNNLHRVVVFRDGADKVGAMPPLSAFAGADPLQLWAHLAAYEQQTSGKVLAIPHNANLSNGLMFPTEERLHGRPVDRAYVEQRARWEPVVEVTQIKGDGETHPLLSPDDEFADYETWDFGNMRGVPKVPAMLAHEYARAALGLGLQLERRLGTNPYRFGMIGSTDSHTGLSAVEENNFFGKHSGVEPGPKRMQRPVGEGEGQAVYGWQMAASGYAAVWARDNTREALWDAIQRREVYATTGSRISVRFFGGWAFESGDSERPDLARTGYGKGVPMGGQLAPTTGETPVFLVAATKDPMGANLDRVQIVKGWLDAAGERHEQVYDAAWSDNRERDANGRLAAVGDTADTAGATWRDTIGAPQLAATWRDPDFDPALPAFYYARVIEIPTPRWTAYDAARFDVAPGEQIPLVTTERAYTSPIWYQPAAGTSEHEAKAPAGQDGLRAPGKVIAATDNEIALTRKP